jgi:uncharacterized protein YehS (DUF1456 family)
MTANDLHDRPYQRPPLLRGVDPQRMNWLWRLIREVADLDTAQLVEALHASGIAVNGQRVDSWLASDRTDAFFPISIAELERNLRAVLALRIQREAAGAAAMPDAPITPDA